MRSTTGEESTMWDRKGRSLMENGNLTGAVEAFGEAIKGAPSSPDAYFRRGVCHYMLGSYHSAARDMQAASLLGREDAFLWCRFLP